MKTSFKKLEYSFSVESTTIESVTFSYTMPCQKRNRMRSIQNGLEESKVIKILLIQVFVQYNRYNKFAIDIPGF